MVKTKFCEKFIEIEAAILRQTDSSTNVSTTIDTLRPSPSEFRFSSSAILHTGSSLPFLCSCFAYTSLKHFFRGSSLVHLATDSAQFPRGNYTELSLGVRTKFGLHSNALMFDAGPPRADVPNIYLAIFPLRIMNVRFVK